MNSEKNSAPLLNNSTVPQEAKKRIIVVTICLSKKITDDTRAYLELIN